MMIFHKNRLHQAALAMAKYTIDDDDNDVVEDPVGVEKREPATPVFAGNCKILKKMFSVSSIMSKLLFLHTQEATIALAKFTIEDEDLDTDTDAEDCDDADIAFVESDASVAESEDGILPLTMHSYSDDDEMKTGRPASHDNTMLHANKRQRTDYYVRPTYNHQVPPETMFASSACFSATRRGALAVFADALLLLCWQHIVPQLTWIMLCLILYVDKSYRIPLIIIVSIPLFQNCSEHNVTGLWILRQVSRIKKLKVQIASGKTLSNKASVDRSSVYTFHPHGRFPLDIYAYLASSEELSEIRMAGGTGGKYAATIGFVVSLYGKTMDATKIEMLTELDKKGTKVGLFPGGAREMHECSSQCVNSMTDPIRIVQHNGFLRLARTKGSDIVPCFVFGFQESFSSPFQTIQRRIYQYTKISFPIWYAKKQIWPQLRTQENENCLVVGSPIYTTQHDTDDSLIKAYWAAVDTLFEENKHRFPEYAERKLDFLHYEVPKVAVGPTILRSPSISDLKASNATKTSSGNARSVTPQLRSVLRFSTWMNVFILVGTFAYYAATSSWFRSSYWSRFENVPNHLIHHLVSGVIWTITSALNFFTWKSRRVHKSIGYIGVLSLIVLFLSGMTMQLELLGELFVTNVRTDGDLRKQQDFTVAILNYLIPTFSVFQVALGSFYLMGRSIRAALEKNIARHKISMSQIHLLMADMVTPRIVALCLRFVFPMLDKKTAFTVACIIQARRHIQIIKAKAPYLIPSNYLSVFLSSCIISVALFLRRTDLISLHILAAGAMITFSFMQSSTTGMAEESSPGRNEINQAKDCCANLANAFQNESDAKGLSSS